MKWIKKGLIYSPKETNAYGFMTPHAMLLNGDTIRLYGGIRDGKGISRIKYIDIEAKNPNNIIKIQEGLAFDIGQVGTFDDNGIILGDIIKDDNKLLMVYVGFQKIENVKFYAFSGLAISYDCGERFERVSEVPIFDRTDSGRYGNCIHSVLYENGLYKIYYSAINDWKTINNVSYPVYEIWYLESDNLRKITTKNATKCIACDSTEYRIGRPKVYKFNDQYEMLYTSDSSSKEYKSGYAVSNDGIFWTRKDSFLGLNKSDEGWDSQMACYPVFLKYENKFYMFYNGNGMGASGVGYAELASE